MFKIVFTIAILMFFAFPANASEKMTLAVYDFDASQVQESLAGAVTDFIQTGLSETGRFNIIDRSNVQKILKEMQFQKTGATTTESAVKIGKMLNVSNIVIGRVTQIGSKFVISIQLVNVELGQIIHTDSVECYYESLLNTAAKKLAVHFSKGVSIKGKILKVMNQDSVVINLGSDDGISKNQEFLIERVEDTVKDDSGKVVYQNKKRIGIVKAIDVSEEASKAVVVSKEETIKEGDIVDIKKEKQKPLEPIVGAEGEEGTVRNGYAGSEEGYFELFGSYDNESNIYSETKNTDGTIAAAKSKAGSIAPHWAFGIGGGGSLFQGKMKWLADLGGNFKISFPQLKNNNNVEIMNYTFILGTLNLSMRFYPFTPLLNAEYQEYKTAKEQRGWLSPYISVGGNLHLGVYNPDTTKTTTTATYDPLSAFVFGGGADARAGLELGNAIFVEFIYKFSSSAKCNFDILSAPKSKTKTGATSYEFDLNSTAIGFGFRF